MIIQDKTGSAVEVFVETFTTGKVEVIDGMFSGPNREILEQVSLASGLMAHDEDGQLIDAPYCESDWIGHRVETEAVLASDGETIITPAVLSPEYLVNWRWGPRDRLSRDEDGFELWQLAAIAFAQQGVTVQLTDTLRAYELQGVRQIDGNGVQTPLRVWAE